MGEVVRPQKYLVIQKSAAHEVSDLRVSPLVAVVTHKVQIINDLSFDVQCRHMKGGINGDTDHDSVAKWLCAEALPKFSDELVPLTQELLETRMLMSMADV